MTSGEVLVLQGHAFLISTLQGGARPISNCGLCVFNNNSHASVWATASLDAMSKKTSDSLGSKRGFPIRSLITTLSALQGIAGLWQTFAFLNMMFVEVSSHLGCERCVDW
jgi:hypothetical protein